MAKKVNKRFQELLKKIDKEKKYSVDEALANIKNLASAKFDETIEIALKLNVDPRHADQMVRGSVVLVKQFVLRLSQKMKKRMKLELLEQISLVVMI